MNVLMLCTDSKAEYEQLLTMFKQRFGADPIGVRDPHEIKVAPDGSKYVFMASDQGLDVVPPEQEMAALYGKTSEEFLLVTLVYESRPLINNANW